MTKYKKILFIMFLFVLPMKVNALCDNNEVANLQKMASNITYSYEYVRESDSFNITFTNLNNSLYVQSGTTSYKYNGSSELILTGFTQGAKLGFSIYDSSYCLSTPLKIIYVTTPKKNRFYQNELCKGIEEYQYCQEWANVDINADEFVKMVSEYKNPIEETIQEEIIVKNYFAEKMIDIYIHYYFIILPLIIILCILGIYFRSKKRSL